MFQGEKKKQIRTKKLLANFWVLFLPFCDLKKKIVLSQIPCFKTKKIGKK
jgi:hypothetical protein